MRILVTGAAGFIGSQVASVLSKAGHQVVATDILKTDQSNSIQKARIKTFIQSNGIEFHELNLTDRSAVSNLFKKSMPDIVLHLAALPGVRSGIADIYSYTQSNLISFSNVLEFSGLYNIKELIYASSSSVYGNAKEFIETNMNLSQESFYAATKFANERMASIYKDEIPSIGLRFFSVYGPFGRPYMAYYKIARALKTGTEFEVYGDLEMARDFTFITDITDCISLIVDLVGKSNRADLPHLLNLGKGEAQSLEEMIKIFEDVSGLKLNIKLVSKQKSDSHKTLADVTLLGKTLNYIPSTTLTSGIDEFYNWFVNYSVN